MSRQGVSESFPEVVKQLKGGVVLPAVYVDGEVVSQGYVDYFTIARAVEKTRINGKA